MHLNDRLTIDERRRTADGYLAVNARVARGGNVQAYLGSEVGRPDLAQVRVYRPEGEVFDKDTLRSFAHRPVTLGHPSFAVTADNWNQVAKGWSDGEVARDGEFIRVSMLLADAEAIRAVEAGTRELSMGYDCQLVWEDGVSPAGERYDAKQTQIRGNHIAIVDAARGGSQLRIGDSAVQTTIDTMPTATMTLDQALALPRYQGMSPGNARQYAIRDMTAAQSGHGPDYMAGIRDHHAEQMSGAWKGGSAKDHKPAAAPAFAKDGRPFATLSVQDQAHERMQHDLSVAWR